jgi:hypothetical protein
MRSRKISNIRLNEPLKAVDVNRALDNIINTVNPFIVDTVDAIEATPVVQPVTTVSIASGTGISVVEAPAGTFTITNTLPEDTDVVAGTGISIVEAPAGTFTVTNSDPDQTVALSAGTGISVTGTYPNFTITNTLPEDTNIVAGGGIAVAENPAGTFTIINTNQGGGGGGGQIFYLNGNIPGDAPLPVAGTKELGQPIQPTGTNSGAITLPGTGAYTTINTFVTDLNLPGITDLPAGIWDFNVWMTTSAAQPNEVEARIRLYSWDGTTTTLIATADPVLITNAAVVSQYKLTLIIPQTTITLTTRLYVVLDGRVVGVNSHTITEYYGNSEPSYAHTTIPFAYVENIVAGTAISVVESPTGTYTITNTAPDQTVALTNGTGISIAGTYPNFTITNSDPASSIDVTAGTAISVVESPTGTFAVTNTAPDQIVAMASGTGISVTGTYPNFTITNTDPGTGVNITGGTGVTVTEPTPNNFSVAIGQPVATTDNVTFGVVTASTSVKTPSINPDSSITIQPTSTSATRTVTVQGGTNTLGIGSQVNLTGGQGATTGGSSTITGGQGATAGGAASLIGGASTNASTTGGAVVVRGGNNAAATSTGGAVSIQGGTGTSANGAINIGTTVQSTVNIGVSGLSTTNVLGYLAANTQIPTANSSISPASTSGTGFSTQINGGISTAGIGGAMNVLGGGGNTTGGAVNMTGGSSTTTTGGAATITGGGGVSAGGATSLIGGGSTGASGVGGSVFVTGGSNLAVTSTGGNAYVEAGIGTSNNGIVNIGTDFASLTRAINIGSVGTQNNGKIISLIGGTGTAGTGGNISVTAGTGTTTAGTVTVTAGNSSTTTGGNVGITAGTATGASQTGGAVNIVGGVSNNGGVGGATSIGGGAGVTTGGATIITAGAAAAGGAISITAGVGALSPGGSLTLKSGLSTASDGGELIIQANTGNSVGFRGGHVQIAAGNSTLGTAGNVYVEGGDAATDGTINIGTGTGAAPLGSTSAITIGRTAFNTTINGGVTTPVVVGTYAYAEGSSANVSITNTSTPVTIVYNGVSQSGISLNIATGDFTVPVSGIYSVEFNGIFRAITVPATTWWIAYELFDATTAAVQYTTTCFQPRATTGNSTSWATNDSYEFNMTAILSLTAGRTYRIRARNNTAAGTFVAGFEPTLTNANTSRNGRRFKLSIERKT